MVVLAIRRSVIKRKLQKQLKQSGLPKNLAKQFAKKYQQDYLKRYGSLKGLFKLFKGSPPRGSNSSTVATPPQETSR